MEQTQDLLQEWDARARRHYPRIKIAGEGLMLGAGTVLAGMAKDERGRSRLALNDEPRAMALLATAYDRPVGACVVAKLRRACGLWTEGEKALAHIHLAHAGVPYCGERQAVPCSSRTNSSKPGSPPLAILAHVPRGKNCHGMIGPAP